MKRLPLAHLLFAALLCVALVPRGALAASPYDPPTGISPTNLKLEDVLAAARKSDGKNTPFSNSVEEGQVSAWGLKGKFHDVIAGHDFKFATNIGDLSWQTGNDAGQPWRRNPNGIVTQTHGQHIDQMIDAARIVQYRNYSAANLTLLGRTSGEDAAFVIEAHPGDGAHIWYFFDAKSFLLTRVEVGFPTQRDTYVFSDFHETGPYSDPWHVHSSDGYAPNDVDRITQSMRYNVAVTSADTAMPQTNDKLVAFPAGKNVVKLPSQMISADYSPAIVSSMDAAQSTFQKQSWSDMTEGAGYEARGVTGVGAPGPLSASMGATIVNKLAGKDILIQLTIGGRAFYFILDSGASGILIDSDTVAGLGLSSFGPLVQTTLGKWTHSYALIPQASIGDLVMTNVIARSVPYNEGSQVGTKIAGLVGYDFIASSVLAIDYERGSVTATNPFMFVPPADAIAVPITLDSGQPHIPVQIGQASSDRFILDTGSPNCFIFSPFAAANPGEISDQGKGADTTRISLPWYGLSGIGVPQLKLRATDAKSLTVAGVTFNDWLMFMTLPQSRGWEGQGNDGIIGYDFLKYFTVYLDYPQGQVFLAPNGLARSKAGH